MNLKQLKKKIEVLQSNTLCHATRPTDVILAKLQGIRDTVQAIDLYDSRSVDDHILYAEIKSLLNIRSTVDFLSIVIAIYDEESNVLELTDRIYKSIQKSKIPFELIYVIDGHDNTTKILQQQKKFKKNLSISTSKTVRGFKRSFAAGFNKMNKDTSHVLTMDGDLNHQPEEIINLINSMKDTNHDVIIGSRYIKDSKNEQPTHWKRTLSYLFNLIFSRKLKMNVSDTTSGFRLYKRQVIDTIMPRCKSTNFEFLFEILLLCKKFNFKVSEIPITFKSRERGKSKLKLPILFINYIKLIWRDYNAYL